MYYNGFLRYCDVWPRRQTLKRPHYRLDFTDEYCIVLWFNTRWSGDERREGKWRALGAGEASASHTMQMTGSAQNIVEMIYGVSSGIQTTDRFTGNYRINLE